MRKYICLLILLVLTSVSCTSLKQITLFQTNESGKMKKQSSIEDTTKISMSDSIKISPFDELGITISSESEALKKLIGASSTVQGNTVTTVYQVSPNGNITLPYIGDLNVQGITVNAVRNLLHEKLTTVLLRPYVQVKFMSFKVNVMGEVGSAGPKSIPYDHANIVDIISASGGITDYGDATQIEIIRGGPDNPKVIYYDMTQLSSFGKEGYNILPGDIVYVKPRRVKTFVTNLARIQAFVSLLTLLNTILVAVTYIRLIQR